MAWVMPELVFSFLPAKTTARANFPLAMTLTFFAFFDFMLRMAFIDFMLRIAFIDFMLRMAFIDFFIDNAIAAQYKLGNEARA